MRKVSCFIVLSSLLVFEAALADDYRQYIVKKGDSIARISDYYGVSQKDVFALNHFNQNHQLGIGDRLLIPNALRPDAAKGHTVTSGDTLSSIAKQHGTTVPDLISINKLSGIDEVLSPGRTLLIPAKDKTQSKALPYRSPAPSSPPSQSQATGTSYQGIKGLVVSGKKADGGILHTVQKGQTVWTISRAYNIPGNLIARSNQISKKNPLSAGQEIIIPGAKEVIPVRAKGYEPHPVKLVSVWSNERTTLRLLNKFGSITKHTRNMMRRYARSKRKPNRSQNVHPRLIDMLQRVAERFPGSAFEIVSGYRPKKRGQRLSRHNRGRALDFRLQGVENDDLYDYIKDLPNVGAGYYPNSVFVHLDIRGKNAQWVDISKPGQPAIYLDKDNPEQNGDGEPEDSQNSKQDDMLAIQSLYTTTPNPSVFSLQP